MLKRLFGSQSNSKQFEFQCTDCGKMHKGSPSFSFAKPTYYFDVPENERASRVKLSDDLCTIAPDPNDADSEPIYCVRATLDVPIHDALEPFCWGVWISQSEQSFNRYVETFSDDQGGDGSFGWLAVTMPFYNANDIDEPYEHLACDVEWEAIGQRPKLVLQECPHELYHDQSNGISWEKAVQIARQVMHPKE